MKIGIDAKWFYEGPPSGRVVVRNIIKHLAELSPIDEFYIFLDKRAKGQEFPYQRSNIHLFYVWADNNMLSNIFVIPFCAYKLHLDIFIFQNFSPFIFNSKRYVFIYDVLFKAYPKYYSRIERLYFWPIKYLAYFANRLCTISETEKLRLIKHGYGKADHIDVIYLGVDKIFMPREDHKPDLLQAVAEKYDLPSGYILYVGRLNIRKNIFNLLKSLAIMKNATMPLVIVGAYDGKMSSLGKLIAELGIGDRVIFAGHVTDEDLPLIISLARVFCFVSYAEAFGLPVLEAMASGIPVVTSDRTCLPEICADAALFADPDNPVEIAFMVDQLLDDENLWLEMRRLGIIRAQSFTWRISAKRLMDNLSKMMEAKHAERVL